MSEQIENAIEIVNKYLRWSILGRNFVSEEQIELEKSLIFLRDYVEKTSKVCEEVLQELEELKQEFKNDKNIHEAIAVNISIKRIKQKLADLEEVR